jgi:hypothetical protein
MNTVQGSISPKQADYPKMIPLHPTTNNQAQLTPHSEDGEGIFMVKNQQGQPSVAGNQKPFTTYYYLFENCNSNKTSLFGRTKTSLHARDHVNHWNRRCIRAAILYICIMSRRYQSEKF